MPVTVGDAPIATARWRMVTEAGDPVVEIDLLGVLVDKRQKGYGKQLVLHILEVRQAPHSTLHGESTHWAIAPYM
jgi:hypothetical protein